MNDVELVGVVESAAQPGGQLADFLERKDAVLGKDGTEALALHVLHGNERVAVFQADIVNADDVGMREAARRLKLALETGVELLELVVFEALVRFNDLDGDLAANNRIFGEVNDAHGAATDGVANLVAAELLCLSH